ncbi:MAG: polyribonucleotide nucleotidyltransferase [Candidatus Ryanbacteria bacterium CG10_big_fil_rev_8_21_14_0_10_43_42]|uniref:Polyribonucleotide nucleotidyltransferase n=1 Tax=Candidatus Ryanbacteria bacterium CG10_big_fil_rev_8_21_14_0_10_43_42 TaxID=1974864 RepID=A0A2M8KW82_9BACT|nr:MAG: polyribonucleotide nucleotidyltransferase [Candidatus Ryanbacteria bacterium CG10_big_fil_rev_8_21_14_0_10_43_42]
METKQFSIEVAGKPLVAEFSPLAEQANGSVLVRYGETVVFATAVMDKKEREGAKFFPLMVDYEEKFYAAGRILGSRFMRREGRPSEEAILMSRVIDRSIRPLFDHRMRNDLQVTVTALAVDEQNDPDVPALFAASLALAVSNIPWNGPVAAVRVCKTAEGMHSINPTYEEREDNTLDTFFTGVPGHINMIEASAKEASEEEFITAFEEGSAVIKQLIAFQNDIVKEMGVPKRTIKLPEPTDELIKALAAYEERVEDAIYETDKVLRAERMNDMMNEWMSHVAESYPDASAQLAEHMFEELMNNIVHRNILDKPDGEEKRADGRALNEIRPLFTKTHITERNHGSAIFYRGQTHILSVATLGAPGDSLLIEGMEVREKRHFMHHYNFPPFSVGEVKPMRGPGRREIGHGALAEKALRGVIPPKEDFPYTIRVVSETFSSNGSSSMGSVCASSMALMDAGVPIKAAVAGSSMGLMVRHDKASGKVIYKVLTDIQGVEDHLGDMDFKVAGTRTGITAIQLDIKVEGVTLDMIRDAFAEARNGRLKILDAMDATISETRKEISPYAPKIITMTIKPDKIREVIGPGGKVINEIIDQTGCQIDIEQDGSIFITGTNTETAMEAQKLIEEIVQDYEVGQKFTGRVTRLFNFGAMVEIAPRTEGMVHISELAPFRVEQVTDMVDVGDEVPVEIIAIDDMGRINLSIKRVATLEAKNPSAGKSSSRPPSENTPYKGKHAPRDRHDRS